LTLPKKSRMSASSMWFTFRRVIATAKASNASCGPRPGRNSYENPRKILFVDGVEHHGACALDDLVFQSRDCQRPLSTIRLRYVRPARWMRPIRSPVDPSVEILEIALEVRLVVLPGHPVDSSGGFAFERVECCRERATLAWWRSAVNRSFFLCLAACRTRFSAWVTRARVCVRCVLC
jgi:hypothetical protein